MELLKKHCEHCHKYVETKCKHRELCPDYNTNPPFAPKVNHGSPVVPEKKDNVVLPHHYARFKIEPITFICENKLDFFQGNIVKYTVRHDAKNGLEDIAKVIRYAQMYHKFLSGDPDWSK